MAMGTWEGVGQITGTWLGAIMWIATAPVVAVDGPLPIADVAWVAANIRNTNYLRKKGGLIGAELDDVLAEGTGSAPAESWGAGYDTPEVSNKKDTPYVFNKLPEASGFKMDFEFSFDNWVIPPIDYQPLSVVALIEEPTPMKLTYVERDSRWPFWN